TTTTTTT
nr:Chain B, hepta-threonine [Candida albicans]